MSDGERKHRAGLVLTIIFGLSVVLGVLAYWRYTVSERHLHEVFATMDQKGTQLSAEGCITEVLNWHREGCAAMQSMCDHAIPMVLTRCLVGKDRSNYCDNLDIREASKKWTYRMCKERGISPKDGTKRRFVKACGNAYGSIESFCKSGQKGVVM